MLCVAMMQVNVVECEERSGQSVEEARETAAGSEGDEDDLWEKMEVVGRNPLKRSMYSNAFDIIA